MGVPPVRFSHPNIVLVLVIVLFRQWIVENEKDYENERERTPRTGGTPIPTSS